MDYEQEEKNGFKIIKIQGRIDSASAPIFESDMNGFVESGHHQLILDMTQLDYIASAGLRVILALAKKIKGIDGGKFGLYGLNQNVSEVFDVSGFSAILKIYRDEKAALSQL